MNNRKQLTSVRICTTHIYAIIRIFTLSHIFFFFKKKRLGYFTEYKILYWSKYNFDIKYEFKKVKNLNALTWCFVLNIGTDHIIIDIIKNFFIEAWTYIIYIHIYIFL